MNLSNLKENHLIGILIAIIVLIFLFQRSPSSSSLPADDSFIDDPDSSKSIFDPSHTLSADIEPFIEISEEERSIPKDELIQMLSVAVDKGHTLRTKKLSTILIQVAQQQKQEKEEASQPKPKKGKLKGKNNKGKGKAQVQEEKPKKKKDKTKNKAFSKSTKSSSNNSSGKKDSDYMDSDTSVEPSGYYKRNGWHLKEFAYMEGSGCTNMDGQCSTPKENARKLCDSLAECLGYVCNKGRADCQLRKAPLKHEQHENFVSYYKPGQLAATIEGMADREREWKEKMKPGHLAAKDFDPNGVCGENGYKCVISYGLYGGNPKYTEGAIVNAELAPKIFPGWVVRIYHDNSVPDDILRRLKDLKCELVKIDNISGGIAGMFWRFLVAEDDTVDRYIIRDSDSRLNEREAAAVQEWLESGYSVHSIRDHPNHNRPLNGGMWGGSKGAVKNIRELVMNSNRGGYGADLDFLGAKVWPQIEYDQISHDSYSCQQYINAHPFPTRRENYQHVGQVFENGQPRQSDITCCMIHNHSPKACRKKEEWLYG